MGGEDSLKILLESRKCGFLTDNVSTLNVKQHISIENIQRKATSEEIKNHLINVAKNKGFVHNVEYLDVFANTDGKIIDGKLEHFINDDSLYNNGNLIYWRDKWEEIVEDKSQVVEMRSSSGNFKLEVSKKGIYYSI